MCVRMTLQNRKVVYHALGMLRNDICPYCGKEVYGDSDVIHTTVTRTRRGHKTIKLNRAHLYCAYPGKKGNNMLSKIVKGELSRTWLNKEII